MSKCYQYVWVIILSAAVLIISNYRVYAQFDRADSIAATFPDEVHGFETDAPLMTYKQANQESNLAVSIIYYRIDGSEQIKIKVEDFSLNSSYFNRQYNKVKQQMSGPNDPEYHYKGNLKQERREQNSIEQVIYLDRKLILTITHGGTIRDTLLSNKILCQINLEQIR